MKNIILTFLFCLPVSLFAQENGQATDISSTFETAQDPVTASQPAWTFDEMMKNLQRVHKMIHDLPYEYGYIKDTLMPQVKAERQKIAPHYPERGAAGSDHEIVNQHFQDWYLKYPGESEAYIKYVERFVRSHKKSN